MGRAKPKQKVTDVLAVPAVGVNTLSKNTNTQCRHVWLYMGGHNEWWVCSVCQARERR